MKITQTLWWITGTVRLFIYLSCLMCCGLSYAGLVKGQTPKNIEQVFLDIDIKGSFEAVVDELEDKTGYLFAYNETDLKNMGEISLSYQNASLYRVLTDIVQQTGLHFKQVNNNISVTRPPSSPFVEIVETLDIEVTGTVISGEDNLPLPGVNVVIKGAGTGTVTDIDGKYSLSVPDASTILVFSSIGFQTKEVVVGSSTRLDITMEVDMQQLGEVVVIGYGTQKKSDLTGAISSVSAEKIEERPVTNVVQALQGNAAGVHVNSNVRPGELPTVRIRGNRSINASNDPLYVIDGIPVISQLGVNSFSLNDINPNDIASVEILKDASATAIYGSRGANGVILVTTKKGKKGRLQVNYNSTVSFDSYKNLTVWKNGGQYIDLWRESMINGRLYGDANVEDLSLPAQSWYPDPFLDEEVLGLSQDTYARDGVWMGYEWEEFGVTPRYRPTTAAEQAMGWPDQVPIYNSENVRTYDWQDEVTRQGITNIQQLSLSSGSENSSLYLSLGYYNQVGVQKDQDFERFTLNINGDISPTKWLTVGSSVLGSFSIQNYGFMGPNTSNTGSKDLFSRANDQFPYAIPRDDAGNLIQNPGGNLNLWNPIMDIDQAINERRASSLMANIYTEIKFTPWLRYRLNFGGQMRNFRNGSWTGPESSNHLTVRPNTAGMSREENFSWVAENLLFIDKTFNDIHTIGVTLLQSSQYSRMEGLSIGVSNTIVPASMWYDLSSNTNGRPDGYGSSFTENTIQSYMARVNYTLMDKYLLTASGRYDGASVLAPGQKWDFFPSFSVAWKIQEEEFMSNVNWMDELKVRLGYGVTGNSSVSPYTTSGPLSRNPYVFESNAAIGFLPQLVRNPDLGWEKTAQLNAGLDFMTFKGRIKGTFEFYKMNTTGLIFQRSIPAVTGYVQKFENIGSTQNRGFELTLSTINMDKGNFFWQTDINFGINREEITELVNGEEDMISNNLFIGHPIHTFYDYENDGIWQNTEADLEEMRQFNENGHRFYPGTVKVVDQNGDYTINADDRVVVGSRQPKWTGGLTNTFGYGDWTLSFMAYARIGQTYMGGYPHYGGIYPNGRYETDFWDWDNPGGKWPLPIMGANVENISSSMQFNDGSFVAIRHITLGYQFPTNIVEKLFLSNLSINAQIINPFLFGGEVVGWGINPDDDNSWERRNGSGDVLGGMNSNTILPQSLVFTLKAGF
ncbi:TonB-dependent receptor [Echinicola sp. CAU 1574]|uniref:TonB-dependent receptor n=1 Tax=Echinicola arenosa TaxID=2774144 RepID=A0ABR9AK19_9BACT|nr:TonB-dependent receptor [Echinicola arenosa]MBD8489106.1 TonB-dependent receptor [Echinicola arenosa]